MTCPCCGNGGSEGEFVPPPAVVVVAAVDALDVGVIILCFFVCVILLFIYKNPFQKNIKCYTRTSPSDVLSFVCGVVLFFVLWLSI